jgi:hypothetical protein
MSKHTVLLVLCLSLRASSVFAATCATGVTESTSGAASSSVTTPNTDAACQYLQAGYYVTGGALPPVACPAGSFCPGGNAANGGAAAGTYVAAGAYVSNGGATACPAGTTNALTGAASQGLNALDYSDCLDIAAGYTVGSTGLASTSSTAAGITFAAFTTAVTAANAVVACPVGSFCVGQAAAITFTAGSTTGQYKYPALTTSTSTTACPTGTTNALTGGANQGANAQDYSDCLDIAAGYTVGSTGLASTSSTAAGITFAAFTTAVTAANAIVACPVGSFCVGQAAAITFTAGSTAGQYKYPALTTSTSTTACPTGFTNALTGAAAQGVNAVDASACKDIAAGYTIIGTGIPLGSSVAAATLNTAAGAATSPFVAVTNGVGACPAGSYCVGRGPAAIMSSATCRD